MSKEVVGVNIRFPKELHKELKELAEKDNRSLQNYVITTLINHVNSQKGASRDTNRKIGE